MINSKFVNMKIVGIGAAVPTKRVDAHTFDEIFGAETVDKIISVTGVRTTYHALPEQTSSDFGFAQLKNCWMRLMLTRQRLASLFSPQRTWIISSRQPHVFFIIVSVFRRIV